MHFCLLEHIVKWSGVLFCILRIFLKKQHCSVNLKCIKLLLMLFKYNSHWIMGTDEICDRNEVRYGTQRQARFSKSFWTNTYIEDDQVEPDGEVRHVISLEFLHAHKRSRSNAPWIPLNLITNFSWLLVVQNLD